VTVINVPCTSQSCTSSSLLRHARLEDGLIKKGRNMQSIIASLHVIKFCCVLTTCLYFQLDIVEHTQRGWRTWKLL